MLLRVRVTLPDRPGALGQVARTLGVAGADIVQVTVLERLGGRAVDDFTVVWPGAARVDRLLAGLAAIPGVQVDGVWRAIGAPVTGGQDAELLAQVAANPTDGLATLVDAVPGLLAADWAAAAVVPADWAIRSGSRPPANAVPPGTSGGPGGRSLPAGAELRFDESELPGAELLAGLTVPADEPPSGGAPAVAYASWRAPVPLRLPEVTPLRARPMDGPDGVRYASVPFGRAGLVLMVARTDGDDLPAAAFHVTEVDRIAQLVRAATVILGDRLDLVGADPVTARR
ncbi:amino acid-binding protein [Solwaraspora sp. WMMB335]|uniref:amino acid-binding protein n=1 Tax=Solwaraspora sp. WMMB335 TaxID=3404118 RepID=UPI003B93753B